MGYKNPKELLTAATALPAAIEARLPEGAPKVSTMLLDAAEKMPDFPDFLIELPDLPPVPELPELPGTPALGRRYVSGVEVRPAAPAAARAAPTPASRVVIPSPATGVLPEVVTRRGM